MTIPPPIRKTLECLSGLAFPNRCQIYHQHAAQPVEGFVCDPCRQTVRPIRAPWCGRCGLPMDTAPHENNPCPNCLDTDWQFDQARSLLPAQTLVREIIHRYKYHQQEFFEPLMAHWIRTHLDVSATDYQAVIPVPLHDTKQRERGFNQAAQLAGMISHQTGIPQIINLLRRIRPTDSQTHLTRSKRQANMKNAFAAAFSPVEFISVLLVDDVLTTGATASECAKTLKRCGISKVNVLTLARGMPAYF